jgi:hypothetical protein
MRARRLDGYCAHREMENNDHTKHILFILCHLRPTAPVPVHEGTVRARHMDRGSSLASKKGDGKRMPELEESDGPPELQSVAFSHVAR